LLVSCLAILSSGTSVEFTKVQGVTIQKRGLFMVTTVKWSEANCGEGVKGMKCSEVEWRKGHGEMWADHNMTLRIPLLLLFSV
jgi:hypothetical protein